MSNRVGTQITDNNTIRAAGRESAKPLRHILVFDAYPYWVRSLFIPLGTQARVHFVNIGRVGGFFRAPRDVTRRMLRWRDVAQGVRECDVFVPGRFRRLSAALVARICRAAMGRECRPDVVIFTLPNYPDLPGYFRDATRVYYCYDPYECYNGWDPAATKCAERQIVAKCDAVYAVSRQLCEDFSATTTTPVFLQPNAVSDSFVTALATARAEGLRPFDLGRTARIIGCVGLINDAFDFEMIDFVTIALNDATFVFVGPLSETDAVRRAYIQRVLAKSNVRWLGPKAHDQLPLYLSAFDVCFCPMRLTPQNHRRSYLRLYDYLASGNPIVSTAVRDACEHGRFVSVADSAEHCVMLLRNALSETPNSDPVRTRYVASNTWSRRAEEFLSRLDVIRAPRRTGVASVGRSF